MTQYDPSYWEDDQYDQYEAMCGDKVPHKTRMEAISAAETYFHETGERLATYPCDFCVFWHTGHNRHPQNQRKRRKK